MTSEKFCGPLFRKSIHKTNIKDSNLQIHIAEECLQEDLTSVKDEKLIQQLDRLKSKKQKSRSK